MLEMSVVHVCLSVCVFSAQFSAIITFCYMQFMYKQVSLSRLSAPLRLTGLFMAVISDLWPWKPF